MKGPAEMGKAPTAKSIALQYFRKKHWCPKSPSTDDQIACAILHLALAHPEDVSRWLRQFAHYREAEGFSETPECTTGWTLMQEMVARRPEYKSTRRKLVN
jgi:hypothetical protein